MFLKCPFSIWPWTGAIVLFITAPISDDIYIFIHCRFYTSIYKPFRHSSLVLQVVFCYWQGFMASFTCTTMSHSVWNCILLACPSCRFHVRDLVERCVVHYNWIRKIPSARLKFQDIRRIILIRHCCAREWDVGQDPLLWAGRISKGCVCFVS